MCVSNFVEVLVVTENKYKTSICKLMYPIHAFQTISAYQEIGIQNCSSHQVYICDSTGVCATVETSPGPFNISEQKLVIYKRQTSGKRTFDNFQRETVERKDGLMATMTEITISAMLENGFVYIEALDLCVGLNKYDVLNNHPKIDANIIKRYGAIQNVERQAENTAPLKIIVNDPKGRTNRLYTHWGDHVVAIHVSNNANIEPMCRVLIATQSGQYSEYTFDLESILDSTQIECVTKQGVLCIAPTYELVARYVHTKKFSAGNLFTQQDVQRAVESETQKLTYKLNEAQNTVTELKAQVDRLSAENRAYTELNANLQKRLADEENRRYESLKRTFDIDQTRRKMHHDECMAERRQSTEETKLEKEKESRESAKISTFGTIMKTIAVVVPVVITLITIGKTFISNKDDTSFGVFDIIKAPLNCLKSVFRSFCFC